MRIAPEPDASIARRRLPGADRPLLPVGAAFSAPLGDDSHVILTGITTGKLVIELSQDHEILRLPPEVPDRDHR